jgi:cytoskeletal protein CcmA (bactofilin family)
MWKNDQQRKTTSDTVPPSIPIAAVPPAQQPTIPSAPPMQAAPVVAATAPAPGASLRLKGDIHGAEDLVLHGRVEGKVSLPGHTLTVGPGAEVFADIAARTLIVNGAVTGNVAATERFEIRTGGRMNGTLTCPNVIMSEGSEFTGGIDMRRNPANIDDRPVPHERRAKPSV